MLAQQGDLQMNSSSQTCTQVGGTREDKAKMFVPHEFMFILFHGCFKLGEAITEACEDLLHIASLLHRDDSGVIFLVHPDEEILLLIVPDSSSIWPISSHA